MQTEEEPAVTVFVLESAKKNYEINGRLRETDTAAQLIDGAAYIPLRALAEFLGYRVEYTPSTNL